MHPDDINALELHPALRRRWGRQLRKSLRSVLLRQSRDWVDVHISFRNGGERFYYLGFLCAGADPLFQPGFDIVDNAQVFLQLDAVTLSQCIRGLFRRSVARELDAAYQEWESGYLCAIR